MPSPLYAANNLIIRAKIEKTVMTHLKLQKMLYILYARYLAVTGSALFAERFEAWEYGPVLSGLYQVLRDYDAKSIRNPVADSDGKIRMLSEDDANFGIVFSEVWNRFGRLTPYELVSLTHGEGSAWWEAKEKYGLGGFLDDDDIKKDGSDWFA